MARKSRKVQVVHGQAEQAPVQIEKVFATAIYARLSIEDNRIKGSSSIEDQIEIVKRYIEDKSYLQLAGAYCDNGSTGTNFDRDGFQTLMEDIKRGKIQCLAVKDLSRFARNYLEAGNYLEKIFPFLGVRFISVNDNIDTFDPKYDGQGMVVALKTLVHDFYAKDLSNKIKAAMKTKMQNGDFIGDYAPYGYVKSPDNKNKLVIDDEAAQTVRNIFKWRLDGLSCSNIAHRLNDMNVLTPNNYKHAKGMVNAKRYSKRVRWYYGLVKGILDNATYAGLIINGKTRTLQHQGFQIEKQPESNWLVVEGTHEAIVPKRDFEAVRRISDEGKEKWHNRTINEKRIDWAKQENIFTGILYCAECRNKLHRYTYLDSSERTVKNSFYCRYCKSTLPKDLRPKCMMQIKLEAIVSSAINKHIEVFSDNQGIISRVKVLEQAVSKQAVAATELTGLKRKLSQLNSRLTTLYTNYQDGVLTDEDYQYLKGRYDSDKSVCSNRINELGALLLQYEQKALSDNKWLDAVERIKSRPLNSDILTALVERIEITHEHQVLITYKFQSPLGDNAQTDQGSTQ